MLTRMLYIAIGLVVGLGGPEVVRRVGSRSRQTSQAYVTYETESCRFPLSGKPRPKEVAKVPEVNRGPRDLRCGKLNDLKRGESVFICECAVRMREDHVAFLDPDEHWTETPGQWAVPSVRVTLDRDGLWRVTPQPCSRWKPRPDDPAYKDWFIVNAFDPPAPPPMPPAAEAPEDLSMRPRS